MAWALTVMDQAGKHVSQQLVMRSRQRNASSRASKTFHLCCQSFTPGQHDPLIFENTPLVESNVTSQEREPLTLDLVVQQLEVEKNVLQAQLQKITAALSVLEGTSNHGVEGRRRQLSASARARIAAAQRTRWAKAKGQKVVSISSKKRKMSASAIARIRAAQKARWAKWRKQRKVA